MHITKLLFFLALTLAICGSAQADVERIEQALERDYSYLENLYRRLHQNPELPFHEKETAATIAAELRQLGFDVTEQVGGHGLVGVFKNGKGPTVMLRTDLDALPVQEQTGLRYASTKQVADDQGNTVHVMHACGHDVHMTVFVGTARRLIAAKDKWRGTLVMIGQPAEERGAGARQMLADGLFERFPRPDYNLALHVSADLPAGKVAYTPEWALANVDSVDIEVYGIGGHGAYPHTTKDPVVLAAQIIVNLQTLVSREVSPLEPAVITVGSIHGGTKHNVIGDKVHLQLTVRSYTDEVRNTLLDGIRRVAEGQALAMGLPKDKLPKVTQRNEYTPAVYNDPTLTERIRQVLVKAIGAEQVVKGKSVMGGEDFARYGRVEPRIPSLMLWLGAVDPVKYAQAQQRGESLPSLHSPFFAPLPEPTIKTGVISLTNAALELFTKH